MGQNEAVTQESAPNSVDVDTTNGCPGILVFPYNEGGWRIREWDNECDETVLLFKEGTVESTTTELTETVIGIGEDQEWLSGNWSLAIAMPFYGIVDGPNIYGVSGVFLGNLKMYDMLYFHFDGGPGLAWINDEMIGTVTALAGLMYRPSDFIDLTIGARRSIGLFDGYDAFRTWTGEIQARINVGPVGLFAGVGYGMADYQAEETVTTSTTEVYGLNLEEYENTQTRLVDADGEVWNAILGVEFNF